MKKILKNSAACCLLIFLFLYSPFTIMAQKKESTIRKVYLQAGAGGNTLDGDHGELSLQTIFNNKWSATISYHSLSMKPKNLPSDYVPGTGTFLFFIPYSDNVVVNMNLFSLTAGKYFQTGKKSWITTEAGLSIVNGETASFQRTASTTIEPFGIIFGITGTTSNYNYTIENKSSIGAMIRADYNWAFSRFFGLGAGVFANFNSIQSPVGYNLKLTMGWMGRKAKGKL
ncbi:MAG TPA: hypothetical protein VFZ33_05190 [Chitinophagaceae bacterium]